MWIVAFHIHNLMNCCVNFQLSLLSPVYLFQTFSDGLKSYYAQDWQHAKSCFETVLTQIDDGPSRYYLTQIEQHNGVPPRDFIGYGR